MGCGVQLMKSVVVLFNLILLTAGITIIVFGVKLNNRLQNAFEEIESGDRKQVADAVKNVIKAVGITPILIGSVLVFAAVIGILGALFRNCCALVCYAIILVILTLVIAAVGGVGFWASNKAANLQLGEESEAVTSKLKLYSWVNNDATTKNVDEFQWNWKCCGFWNYTDWDKVRPDSIDKSKYPDSCCSKEVIQNECSLTRDDFKQLGCYEAVKEKLVKYIRIAAIALVTEAALQLFIVILSYTLLYSKSDDDKYNRGQVFAMQPTRSSDNYAFHDNR